MWSDEQILKFLTSENIECADKSIVRDITGNSIYIFIKVDRDQDGKQVPSINKISEMSRKFESHGLLVSFVVRDEKGSELEGIVRSVILRNFPELVQNLFVSFDNTKFSIWVDTKRTINDEENELIREKCREVVKVLEGDLDAVHLMSIGNFPTRTACLQIIRTHAPILSIELQYKLIDRGFYVPNKEWLSRLLDALRKANLIIRRKDGALVLTYTALKNLGSQKNSKSPDISRALDLSRRG